MYGYVYLITNLVNRKQYVGQHRAATFDLNYRGSGVRLHKAYQKYNDFETQWRIEVIEACSSSEELNEQEKYWISVQGTLHPQGYNLLVSGYPTRDCRSDGISKGKKGRVPFNNGERVIYREPEFQEEGWVRGDLPRRPKTEEEKEQLRKSCSGLICVTDGDDYKRVSPDEVKDYLKQGWKLGRPGLPQSIIGKIKESKQGTVWISRGSETKMISSLEISCYLQEGWSLGRGSTMTEDGIERVRLSKTGTLCVNNGRFNKMIRHEELKDYLLQGFVQGRLSKKSS